MRNGWVRQLLLYLAALTLAVALGASLPLLLPGVAGLWLPASPPVPPVLESRPVPAPVSCVRDPANLPPPPPSPDSRPHNYLHSCGNRLYDAQGREARIAGINWSGMETGDYIPGGLGTRSWQEILDQVAYLGYNTIRIPFSNEALEPNRRVANVDLTLNPELQGKTPLETLDILVAGARERGLKVILDRHWPSPSDRPNLWYSQAVPEERWIEDWRRLAARYAGNDTVIGVDLSNEPKGETSWGSGDLATDWRLAAERAGDVILAENPYLLILVEGIEIYEGDRTWWGGNLQGVRTDPVRLRVPNRVVYSPHDYGPNISYQSWFGDPLFPGNLPDEWDRRWGYIHREGIAPVVVGEFGGRSVGDDREGQWQKVLLAYLRKHGIGAMVWALNNGWDTGGVLGPDWQTVDWARQEVYRQILALPLDTGVTGVFGRAPTRLKLLVRQERAEGPDGVAFAFQIVNDGPDPLDLRRVELRYWLRSGQGDRPGPAVTVEAAEPLGGRVTAGFEPANQGGQDRYLRLRFAQDAGAVGRYRASNPVTVRFSPADWPGHLPPMDYSFAGDREPRDRFIPWDRMTLYLDGRLVWGTEP